MPGHEICGTCHHTIRRSGCKCSDSGSSGDRRAPRPATNPPRNEDIIMSSRPPRARGRDPTDTNHRRSRSRTTRDDRPESVRTSRHDRPESRARRPSVSGSGGRTSSSAPSARQPYLPSAGRDSSSSYGQASYSTTGSQQFVANNAPYNVPAPNSSYDINEGYNNINYKDRVDPQYNNTGPLYDPARNNLSPHYQGLANSVTAAGYGDISDRFSDLALNSNKLSGNHSDVPTYGRESLNRTASDTQSHDGYKATVKRDLESAKRHLQQQKKKVSPRDKSAGLEAHATVVKAHRSVAAVHASVADQKMAYMEDYPGGLDNSGSYKSHVEAISNSLTGIAGNSYDAGTRVDFIAREDLEEYVEGPTQFQKTFGNDSDSFLDRAPSGSTHNSGHTGSKSSLSADGLLPYLCIFPNVSEDTTVYLQTVLVAALIMGEAPRLICEALMSKLAKTMTYQNVDCTRPKSSLFIYFAISVHKFQGMTQGEILLDIADRKVAPSLPYVAIFRVKTLNGVIF